LFDDKNLEFELLKINMTMLDFNKSSAKIFSEIQEELKFVIRPGKALDKKISKIIKLLKITDVPIVGITDNIYLVGIYKLPI
jgi:hypothetical protein